KLLIPDANTFLFGDYVVPIRITSVSKFGISKDAATYLYPISFQPNELRKDAWTVIDYNNCVTQDETWLNTLPWQPDKLIDNDLKTFWGSKWTTPGPMPYYFIIDLGEVYKLFKMGFDNPIGAESWRGNAKAGTVEVSMDNKQWEPLVSWTAPNIQERSVRFGFPPKEARYIKFSVTEAFNMYQKGAQMNIAEIYAWGQ
ncbi:MAG: discoidin domain-containing protein, partial [Muribaculaceae bacterium]